MRGSAVIAALALFLACFAVGCGESDCEKFGSALCDRACACTDGAECQITQNGVTFTHDNASDCRAFWVQFGCSGGGDDTFDYAGCRSLLPDVGVCVDTGGGENAVEIPADPVCEGQN